LACLLLCLLLWFHYPWQCHHLPQHLAHLVIQWLLHLLLHHHHLLLLLKYNNVQLVIQWVLQQILMQPLLCLLNHLQHFKQINGVIIIDNNIIILFKMITGHNNICYKKCNNHILNKILIYLVKCHNNNTTHSINTKAFNNLLQFLTQWCNRCHIQNKANCCWHNKNQLCNHILAQWIIINMYRIIKK
jgi:hypothetical protein